MANSTARDSILVLPATTAGSKDVIKSETSGILGTSLSNGVACHRALICKVITDNSVEVIIFLNKKPLSTVVYIVLYAIFKSGMTPQG